MNAYKNGFTLIELLVVVLIIGILAAVALHQYQRAVWKSRYMSVLPGLKALINTEERHFLINGKFTKDANDLDIDIPGKFTYESDKNGQIRGAKHLFQLRVDNGTDRANFWVLGRPYPLLETATRRYTFFNKKLYCTAYPNDTKGQKFCESLFGQQTRVKCPSLAFGDNSCYEAHF